ncbi:MAG: methyltransferase domain-containing protein [Nitrococcus mobilis]|nr:methyltransferase domain-containing protein [Nitrococcus mobilis]
MARRCPGRGKLLDIGMEYGGLLDRAKSDGWVIAGLEPNISLWSVARRRFGGEVPLEHGMFEDSNQAQGDCDAVVALNVIEHIHDPAALCRFANRCLRRGGILALRWPIMRVSIGAPAHLHQFSSRSLRYMLHETGFDALEEHWAGVALLSNAPKGISLHTSLLAAS